MQCRPDAILALAFPHHNNLPPQLAEFTTHAAVALDVGLELGVPERSIGLRCCRVAAAGVAVPEAAMDEDDHAMPGQHDVGLAREVLAMQAEPVAHPVQGRSDEPLRSCVLAADAGDVPAAVGFGDPVHGVSARADLADDCRQLDRQQRRDGVADLMVLGGAVAAEEVVIRESLHASSLADG